MSLVDKVFGLVKRIFCQPPPEEHPSTKVPHPNPPSQAQAQPPSKPQNTSYPPPKPHREGAKPHSPRINDNEVNQHNEHYRDLRARANQAGDQMAACFNSSQHAYQTGDKQKAKELSNEGKEHQREMEQLHRQASDWIFAENNRDSGPNEIDLHGLYVKEAIFYTEQAINKAQAQGDATVHLIVGKGLHSQGGVAKVKPAIEALIVKYQLTAQLDPHNEGVLIVQLQGMQRGEKGMGVDEIGRRLEKDDERCIVM